MVRTYEELRAERFWNKVEILSPKQCWHWQASIQSSGYGAFAYTPKRIVTAHRVSWALENNNGNLPDSKLVVMHLCDNKLCVNPSHLTLATVAVNNLDAINKGIRLSIEEHVGIPILNQFCRHGHPRTTENTTFRKKDEYPYALCKVCLRERSKRAKQNLSLEEKRQRMARWRARKNTHTTPFPGIPPL